MGVSKEAPEEQEKPSAVGTSGMILFAGIIGAIAGNVVSATSTHTPTTDDTHRLTGMSNLGAVVPYGVSEQLMARRYGKRVMSFKVPEEALHRDMPHVERNHFASFWEPETR